MTGKRGKSNRAELSDAPKPNAESSESQEVETLRAERDRLAEALERLEARLGTMEVTPLGPPVEWVWARRSFGYDGADIDRGQIFRLKGMRLDEKLVRLGYVQELERDAEHYQCAECGAEFIRIEYRTAHGDLRHQHACICGQVFTSPEALRQHQRVCGLWQSSHRHLTPLPGLERAPAGVGQPG